jgi:hypothetical protein
MKRCPAGYVRQGDRCVRKVDTPNDKRKAAAKKKQKPSKVTVPTYSEVLQASNPYAEFKRIGEFLIRAWDNRPDAPTWAKKSPIGLFYEGLEEAVDLQFQAALAISQGKVAGKDQYGSVERERVESLGTKFIYSPGGFQV